MTHDDMAAIGPRKAVVWIARALSSLVYVYLIAVEVILLIGFVLLMFGANPSAGFTEWAYRNLDRVMEPFRGIFTPIELGTTSGDVEAVFDTSVLFAMIVYGLVALAISALIPWLTTRLRRLERAEAEAERRRRHQEQALAAMNIPDVAPTGTHPEAAVVAPSTPPPSGGPQRPAPPTVI
jgi:hypothetical protein